MTLEPSRGFTLLAMNRLRIGQVAAQANVSVDTVRYYERRGLVQNVERDESGYRRYGPEAVDRIRTIQRAAAIGFSLDELETIFRLRASGKPPCGSVLEMARRPPQLTRGTRG